MCNIVELNCEGCGRGVLTHIADFCVEPSKVHPWCEGCLVTLARALTAGTRFKDGKYSLFLSRVEEGEGGDPELCALDGGRDGELVVFICDDPKAHGICLN